MKKQTTAQKLDSILAQLRLHQRLLLQITTHLGALTPSIVRGRLEDQTPDEAEANYRDLLKILRARISEFDVDLREL